MKNNLVKAALLGSASALGVNWIYDRSLLLDLSKKEDMLFRAIDHDLYKKAATGFDVYPNHLVGQLDFMGEVLYFFHFFYRYEKDLTVQRWIDDLYTYFREDYEYDGYIEAYGKAFLKNYKDALEQSKEPSEVTDHIDKQLGGLIFPLALFENNRSVDKLHDSLQYSKTLTAYKNIEPLQKMILFVLENLKSRDNLQTVLKDSLMFAPVEYKTSLSNALLKEDTNKFIESDAGVACDISQSLPLIYHILAKSTSWEQALSLNATLGGASSARGIFISAILSLVYDIPEKFDDILFYKI